MLERLRSLFRALGPGLVSGAADNDPAGIATYTQVGARFGYDQLWLALFAAPLLTAVQEACARVGLVTGHGLAGVIREHYGRGVLYPLVLLLAVTNTINIGADIGAMSEAARLLIPMPVILLMAVFVALMLGLQLFVSYGIYARYLKWLALSAATYLITLLVVREPWPAIGVATVVPRVQWNFGFLSLAIGAIGTTIAPYMFFWEASQEAEEDREHHRLRPDGSVAVSRNLVRRMRADNAVGMVGSQVISWAIMVVAGTVLHAHGVTDVKTAADAARALEPVVNGFPLAGLLAKLLFAVGIISAGLLVAPVLAASAAYAIAQLFDWKASLRYPVREAPGFYGAITAATLIGLGVDALRVDLISLLVYTSILNGIVAAPLLFFLARIAGQQAIMGRYVSGRLSRWMIYVALAVVVAAIASAVATFRPGD